MEIPQVDSKDDRKKFRLPEWMAHNIERLNTATDFDQYACSPLESEGYLSESLLDTHNVCEDPSTSGVQKILENNPNVGLNTDFKRTVKDISHEHEISFIAKEVIANKLTVKHQSAVDALKLGEIICSSPDSTPYATPEPSPAPKRRISFTTQDSVQSNPQKWFYLGYSKDIVKPKMHTKLKVKNVDIPAFTDKNPTIVNCNNGVKLTISNFDLNAISPSSW